jgi:hypothetical protein
MRDLEEQFGHMVDQGHLVDVIGPIPVGVPVLNFNALAR